MATAELIFSKSGGAGYNFSSISSTPYWLPQIYSKKVLSYFRRALVGEAICNTDYYGEISQYGDTVNILTEPVIEASTYVRNQSITSDIIEPAGLTLTIDRARYFQFEVEDLETNFSHINWQSLAASSAAFQLAKAMDTAIFKDIIADVSATTPDHLFGSDISTSTQTDINGASTGYYKIGKGGASGYIDPLDILARFARKLDEQDIPEENRWVVASPMFYEELASSSSKLMSMDYNQGDGGLRNGLVASGKLRGFSLYKSNALAAGQIATYNDVLIAGHMSAVATASALTKVETLRSTTKFTDIVRGMLVWGTKILRPSALCVAYVDNT